MMRKAKREKILKTAKYSEENGEQSEWKKKLIKDEKANYGANEGLQDINQDGRYDEGKQGEGKQDIGEAGVKREERG